MEKSVELSDCAYRSWPSAYWSDGVAFVRLAAMPMSRVILSSLDLGRSAKQFAILTELIGIRRTLRWKRDQHASEKA